LVVGNQVEANVNTTVNLVVSGGVPPYQVSTSAGQITPQNQLFTPSQEGWVAVQVEDAMGAAADASIRVGGDSIFYAGGGNLGAGQFPREVYKSESGTEWEMVGLLPEGRLNPAMIVFENALWVIAGRDDAIGKTTVFRSGDGEDWETVSSNAPGCAASAVAVHNRRIWLVGCAAAGSGAAADGVFSTQDGIVFTEEVSFPRAIHGGALWSLNGALTHFAGHNGSTFFDDIHVFSDNLSQWALATEKAPMAAEFFGFIVRGDRLHFAGGSAETGAIGTTHSGMSLGEIAAASSLPSPEGYLSLVELNEQLFALTGNGKILIEPMISPGNWTVHANLPDSRQGLRAASFNPDL
jgi:hypothetical protein